MTVREELQITSCRNCTFLPYSEAGYERGLYDDSGRMVPKSGRREFGGGYADSSAILKVFEVTEEISEPVIYLGYLMLHYGHFLIDSMIRFWILFDHPQYDSYKILFTYYREAKTLPSYAEAVLRTLTARDDSRLLFVNHPVRLTGTVIVPEWSYIPGEYIASPYQKTFDAVAMQIKPKGSGLRLYLSRSRLALAGRQEFGERAIEEVFQAGGFTVLYPEQLPLFEQIAYYRAASLMVSTNGSLAHNILWCDRQCRQVLLDRVGNKNMHQDAIDLLRGSDSITIPCNVRGSDHACSCLHFSPELVAFMKEEGCSIRYHRVRYVRERGLFAMKRILRKLSLLRKAK